MRSSESIRREVLAVDAEQPIYDVSAMVDVVSRSVFLPRISMLLLGAFAVSALLLAVVGIYGVVSYTVTQRTRELGVRMALGAQPGDVVRMVLREGLAMVAVGLAVGALATLFLARLLGTLLFGVSPLDPVTLLAAAVMLPLVALAACWLPARRAAKASPMAALRTD